MGQVIAMKRNAGMTALEVLAMVVVLGVVGAITLPKFMTALHQSRESRTKTHLGDLRGALAIYYSDNFGLYPSDEGTPDTRLTGAIAPKYIPKIPFVELDHHYPQNLNTVQDRFDNRGDWVYSMLNGFIAVNSWMPDTKGQAISSW
jgi:type II secretory pathway pseudopilin PulG